MKKQLKWIMSQVVAPAIVTACSEEGVNSLDTSASSGEKSMQKVSKEYLVECSG